MLLEAETRRQEKVTAPTVTLTIDPETCLLLWKIFPFLGDAFRAAYTRHKSLRAWEDAQPERDARLANFRASVGAYVRKQTGLARRDVISATAKEFEITYDLATMFVGEARREARAEATRLKYEEIDRLVMQGLKAKAISERVRLSSATVSNILSKRRKACVRRGNAKDEAA